MIILVALWPIADRRLIPIVGPLATEPEIVQHRFTRCGPGRAFACVIDGDTFRLGSRKIRIKDINAPELAEPRCPAERLLAERSAERLLGLLSEEEFRMIGSRIDPTDRFGRELRLVMRRRPDGSEVSIGDTMQAEGLAHPYRGALEPGWC